MTYQPILAIVGTTISGVGLAWTAYIARREWKLLHRTGEYFLYPRVRRALGLRVDAEVHAVPAAVGFGGGIGGAVTTGFNSDLSVSDRLANLEATVMKVDTAYQLAAADAEAKIQQVKSDVISVREDVRALPGVLAEQERKKTVANLRDAGWGLIATVFGFVLQLVAAVGAL